MAMTLVLCRVVLVSAVWAPRYWLCTCVVVLKRHSTRRALLVCTLLFGVNIVSVNLSAVLLTERVCCHGRFWGACDVIRANLPVLS